MQVDSTQADNAAPDKHEVFMALRPILHAVAYQMLGNPADAQDMVQECFLRWDKTDVTQVRSPKAYLTTIVTRLCLKHLTRARREEPFGAVLPEILEDTQTFAPDDHAQLADSLSVALLVVLKALAPLERAVFLLREVFDCEYAEIASIVAKSEENCRQILRRARARVASRQPRYEVLPQHEEQVVRRFMEAAASGNWSDLIQVLSDDATLVCDGSNLGQGPMTTRGTQRVVELVLQQAARWLGQGALLQLFYFQARPVILAYRNGVPVSSIFLSLEAGAIRTICVITCPVRLRSLLIQRNLEQQAPGFAGRTLPTPTKD